MLCRLTSTERAARELVADRVHCSQVDLVIQRERQKSQHKSVALPHGSPVSHRIQTQATSMGKAYSELALQTLKGLVDHLQGQEEGHHRTFLSSSRKKT